MRLRSSPILLATLVAACATGPSAVPGSGGPSPSQPSISPVPTPTTAAPSPSASSSLAPAGWAEAFGMERATLHDVVAGPSGLIAVGCETDAVGSCARGLLLTSTDGTAWDEVDLNGAANADIWSLRRVGDRLLALGNQIDNERLQVRAVVWTSLDGRSWVRMRASSFTSRVVEDVIDSPRGAIATGFHAPYASEGSGFVLWDVATDGSFGPARDVNPAGRPNVVDGVAWADGRFLAWGLGGAVGDEEVPWAVLMSSPDGRTWTVLPEIAAFQAGGVRQVIGSGGLLVAVGFQGSLTSTSPAAWTSIDGATWLAADVPTGDGIMYRVVIDGSRLVARGRESWQDTKRPVSWASTAGTAWTRLPDDEDLPALPGFYALSRAVVGGRACVAGTLYADSTPPAAAIYCRDLP